MKPSPIQKYTIPHALAGRDVLGAAKTGSGKTLAFCIPCVENLYRKKWDHTEGLGAVIISPTRELALQIFEVLKLLTIRHDLSTALVVGGKPFNSEQSKVRQTNILAATPGRLLQHLEQTPMFDASSVMMLILDEADRLLDMGFADQLKNIMSYMPSSLETGGQRQTLLFSATQTKSVKDLAKLSLKRPEYITTNQKATSATPSGLMETYTFCDLSRKLDVLHFFIRSHLKTKTIVFFSSCKQVRFADAAFRKLQPGVPLMSLHGKIKPAKRVHVYNDFCNKKYAVIFATDIASRGLDFPDVDWVVQLDCPEDPETYIHRVGRTARFKKGGKSLLVLLPSEERMLTHLENLKINMKRVNVNKARANPIKGKLQSLLAKFPEIKEIAIKAFRSYLRSVHLAPDKSVFDIKQLPIASLAESFGLASTPRIKFIGHGGDDSRASLRKLKNQSKGLIKLKEIARQKKLASLSWLD